MEPTDAPPSQHLPLTVKLVAAGGGCMDVAAVTQLLPKGCSVATAAGGAEAAIAGATDRQQQLAVACLAHWALNCPAEAVVTTGNGGGGDGNSISNKLPRESVAVSVRDSLNNLARVNTRSMTHSPVSLRVLSPVLFLACLQINESGSTEWITLYEAIGCEKNQLELTRHLRVVRDGDFVERVLEKKVQVVDCRPLDAFLGLYASAEVAGHFDGAWNVPFRSLFTLDGEGASLLPLDELHEALVKDAGMNLETPVAVISSDVSEAALVATCLFLAGHDSVTLCLSPLNDKLIAAVPKEFTSGIFYLDQLLYPSESGAFDLSPSAHDAASETTNEMSEAAAPKELEEAYSERVNGKDLSKDADADADDAEAQDAKKSEEIVWVKDGKRFFDMPAPITKEVFLDASLAIFRIVSFVLAPYGFPAALRDKFSLVEVKTHFGSLFQDVIEVCSDLVYSLKGLNEGAMAMSVHKWVEEKRDHDCSARVKEINDLWSSLYQVPAVVEVPDLPDEHVVGITKKLKERLEAAVHKRAAWALDSPNESDDDTDDEEAQRKVSAGWQCMYPDVVYALGFIPQDLAGSHKKLSTLQIKSLIQAVAEATWDVVGDESLNQIEFQALCDTVKQEEDKSVIKEISAAAEKSLYVTKHFLTRAVPKDDGYANVMSSVRSAVEEGNRKLRSNRHQVALAAYSKAFEHLPMFHKDLEKAMVGRANCFIQLNQLELARAEADIALKLNPFSADAYTCLGSIDEKQSRPEAAMQHFVTAFILDGSRSTEHAEAIDRVSRLVGRSVAKDVFNKMVMVHELPSPWLTQSYFDSFEHDVDNGAKVPFDIEKKVGIAHAELDAETLLYRAIHHKRKKQFREAQHDICAVVERLELETDLRAMALNLHASFLYVAGDVNAALEAISSSLELKPSLVNSLVKKGGFLSELGDMEAATLCFDEAMELDPNDADVHLHMGQMELLDGNYYKAVQCLRRSMSRSEALAVTHVSYGMALYKSGSVYQANDVFEDAVKTFPTSPEVHLFQGEVLADQGNYADAMKHFLEAFELSPECPLPFLNAGRVYVSTNDPTRAIAHFQQALEIDPRCSSAHLDIAQVLFAQGRTREAFEHFDVAATCCRFLPEVEEVCSCRAMAKMQLKVTEILGVELRHIMRSK